MRSYILRKMMRHNWVTWLLLGGGMRISQYAGGGGFWWREKKKTCSFLIFRSFLLSFDECWGKFVEGGKKHTLATKFLFHRELNQPKLKLNLTKLDQIEMMISENCWWWKWIVHTYMVFFWVTTIKNKKKESKSKKQDHT